MEHARMSRLTDAEFIYAPSQIALASLYLASETHAEQWAKAKGVGSGDNFNIIKEVAQMIGRESDIGGGINVELVREVDRRLRLCKNPEKIPGTKAYVLSLSASGTVWNGNGTNARLLFMPLYLVIKRDKLLPKLLALKRGQRSWLLKRKQWSWKRMFSVKRL